MSFKEELTLRTAFAEEVLDRYMPREDGAGERLAEAMTYSVKAGGKRLRPVFLKAVYDMFGGDESAAEPFMAGIELIHTHSLVHDDLPAIDNDDYRRGRLTTHKVYGNAMGVLAGDALLNYAYEVMLGAFSLTRHPERVVSALSVMAEKTGLRGMLGGQCVDVENDGRAVSADTLQYIYEKKTCALLEAAMMCGALLAGAGTEETETVRRAAFGIGMAFQIRDDILDVTGDEKTLGKPVHSDEKNKKVTSVTLLGLEGAEREVRRLSREAQECLASLGRDGSFLEWLTEQLIGRES